MRGRGGRRVWWSVLGALSAIAIAWALSQPVFAGPDEASHAMRSTAVVRGDFVGAKVGTGDQDIVSLHVPAAYAAWAPLVCYQRSTQQVANCGGHLGSDSKIVVAQSDEYRAFPLYYLVDGLISLPVHAPLNFWLMRVVSALLCAALLASAFVTALESRNRLIVAGVFVAMTPEALYLAGLINANSIEIAAAIGAWTGVVCLARLRNDPTPRLIARTGIALTVLTLTRGLSPFFAIVVVGAGVALCDRERRQALWQRAQVRRWSAGLAVAFGVALGWVLYLQATYPLHRPAIGLGAAFRHSPVVLRQSVGDMYGPVGQFFLWRDTTIPTAIYVVWAVATLGLLSIALATAKQRNRLLVGAVVVVAVGLSITAEGLSIPQIGIPWIGRYGLPLLVGVPIVASVIIEPRGQLSPKRLTTFGSVIVWACIAAQLYGFVATTRRFTVGTAGTLNPFSFLVHPTWSPPLAPPLIYVALVAAALSVLGVFATRSEARGDRGLPLSGEPVPLPDVGVPGLR